MRLYRFSRQTHAHRPNIRTAAEVHSLVAVETDEREIVRINMQCAAIKQAAVKFSLITSEAGETRGQGSCAGSRARPHQLAKRRHRGHWTHGKFSPPPAKLVNFVARRVVLSEPDGETLDGSHNCPG